MTIYYLMVKTHKKTGLRYLCQSKQLDQERYKGSGVDWKDHLLKFGRSVSTEIILECSNKKELNYWGRYYSDLWKITTSVDNFGNRIWANRIPETGCGGGRKPGFTMSEQSKNKCRVSMTGKKQSLETRQLRSTTIIKVFENRSQWNKGIKITDLYSEEERKKMYGQPGDKNPMYGVEVPKKECPHCGKIVDIRNYSRYHGNKCKKTKIT